ncbi:hypothetical protein ACFDR9_005346 [Janthinobacterium sp. CG_23.3]|uniref:hypothetical protein n=1 Tax=Janthinobacterium sp. CG_23.3 TaxID=3349634 RepID=UPI0038D46574
MDISASGVVSGSCFSGQGGAFAVNGTVDAQGNLAFKLSVSGVASATFNGNLDSPLAMGGTWATGGGLSGA